MTRPRLAAALVVAALLGSASLARAVCAPSAQSIFPTSAVAGSDLVAVVRGDALTGAAVTVVGDAGLAATVQSADALTADVRIVIDAAALPCR